LRFRRGEYPPRTYYGNREGYTGETGLLLTLGLMTLELIMNSLVENDIHEAFLKEKGRGFASLGFRVKDLKTALEKAERRGLKVTQGFTREDGSGFAYLDSPTNWGSCFE